MTSIEFLERLPFSSGDSLWSSPQTKEAVSTRRNITFDFMT
jgi:hypothetical protein